MSSEKSRKSRQHFFEVTTIHGLYDCFFASNRFSKFFWSLTLFLCCAVMMYNATVMVMDFGSSPLSTTIKTENIDRFPPLLYCPNGLVGNASTFLKLGITEDDVIFLNDYFWESHTLYENVDAKVANIKRQYTGFHEKLSKLNLSVIELIDQLSGSFNVAVTFMERESHTFKLASFPPRRVVNIYGICYVLTQANALAREGGFSTLLDIGLTSFSKALPGSVGHHYSYGMLFFGSDVWSMNPNIPTFIQDSKRNHVLLKETKMKLKPTRQSACTYVDGPELAADVFRCREDYARRTMGCQVINNASLLGPEMRNVTFCQRLYHRVYDIPSDCSHTTLKEETIPCEQNFFESSVSAVSHQDKNTTRIVIMYAQAVSLIFEQVDMYTWQMFISNVGGLISLLCGASVISFAQLFFYMTWPLFKGVKKCCWGTQTAVFKSGRQSRDSQQTEPLAANKNVDKSYL